MRQFYLPGFGVVNAAGDGREWYVPGLGALNEEASVVTFQPFVFVIT